MTITDFILLMIWSTILLISFKLMKASITITYRQEFSAEDRQLLEDLYNKDGDMDSRYEDTMSAVDEAVKSINDLMLGEEAE